MRITILTLFPDMFDGPFRESILKHARLKGLLEIRLVNIRDFGEGQHKAVDDRPYGGGVGMVLRVDILDKAIKSVQDEKLTKNEERIVLLDARGQQFVQKKAKTYAQLKHLIILCGHYEGVDERVRDLVDETISLGDFILTGGEIPAMLIVDSVARLIPGVLKEDATQHESFTLKSQSVLTPTLSQEERETNEEVSLLEYPQYTTPRMYKTKAVPEVLLSGNHKAIEKFRLEKAQEITKKYRPDLLKK